MKLENQITFPLKNARKSEFYSLIFEDALNITHYFNHDGTYDGYAHDPCVDGGK